MSKSSQQQLWEKICWMWIKYLANNETRDGHAHRADWKLVEQVCYWVRVKGSECSWKRSVHWRTQYGECGEWKKKTITQGYSKESNYAICIHGILLLIQDSSRDHRFNSHVKEIEIIISHCCCRLIVIRLKKMSILICAFLTTLNTGLI